MQFCCLILFKKKILCKKEENLNNHQILMLEYRISSHLHITLLVVRYKILISSKINKLAIGSYLLLMLMKMGFGHPHGRNKRKKMIRSFIPRWEIILNGDCYPCTFSIYGRRDVTRCMRNLR